MPDPADIPSGYYISTPTNNAIANAPAIGIGTGYGAAVTQGTSKTTGVTINAKAGVITTHAAALASLATVQFTGPKRDFGLDELAGSWGVRRLRGPVEII